MWWGFAEPRVEWLSDVLEKPSKRRKVIGGWNDKDTSGEVLSINRLSSALTKVAVYRKTICSIDDEA